MFQRFFCAPGDQLLAKSIFKDVQTKTRVIHIIGAIVLGNSIQDEWRLSNFPTKK